ncbi:MAG: amidophosphoribosyltransferase [Hyphomicrobiales bacterium]|nr:MAG: amidophosphoribosyltransferase [Hyphomicrobiales bacterium]
MGVLRGTAVRAFHRVVDAVLPPVCLACRRPVADVDALCSSCWSGLRLIERPYCERLGTPFAYDLGSGALSAAAIAEPPPFNRARAVAVYSGAARDLVHGLKYRDRHDVATYLARMMVRAGSELLDEDTVLVPVPLHRWRLWRRRFNQSALLAERIASTAHCRVEPAALVRIRATRQQVGLTCNERARNVQGAFRVDPDSRAAIDGRRVVLVDDVLTTGATVNACTRALLRAGAAEVDVLVFARVVGGEPTDL